MPTAPFSTSVSPSACPVNRPGSPASRCCENTGISTAWDDRGNIGKRYLSQDEIGTPYCITVDYDTLEDDSVTIRDRDTTEQKRIKIDDIIESL